MRLLGGTRNMPILWMVLATLPAFSFADTGAPFDLQAFVDSELAAGRKRVVIPPGRHRVEPNNRQHLLLAGLKDVEIIADGAELICLESTRAVTINNCRNLTIHGLTIDYDPLPFTQGRIVSMSDDKQVHEIELFDGYPLADTIVEAKYEIYRADTRTLRYGNYYNFKVDVLAPDRIRVTKAANYARNAVKPEQVGDLIVVNSKHAPGGYMPHAVYASECAGLTLEAVTLYSSNCFGFLENNCDASVYRRCRIDRRPPKDDLKPRADARLRSLDADAYHSKHAVKGPSYTECSARFMGDDCVAINGDYHMIMACDGRKLRVIAKREMNIAPGDPVEVFSYLGKRLPDAKAVSIEPDGKIRDNERAFLKQQGLDNRMKNSLGGMMTDAYTVTLDRALDAPMGSLICSSRRVGNGFLVQDCDFGENRSRGILVKAGEGKIIGNRLSGCRSESIKLSPEYWWLEAGSGGNVVVQDNIISNSGSFAIAVVAKSGSGAIAPAGAHDNITITGNVVSASPAPNIFVTSTTGLKLQGNDLEPDKTKTIPVSQLRQFGLDGKSLKPVMTINCGE